MTRIRTLWLIPALMTAGCQFTQDLGGRLEATGLVTVADCEMCHGSPKLATNGEVPLAGGREFVMGDLGAGSTSIGQGWELLVIAGVVVGGVSLFGGVGSVLGGAIGMLLLQVVQSGLVVVGISPNWQTIAVGGIMILAVGLDVWRRRLPDIEPADAPAAETSPLPGNVPPEARDPIGAADG